MIILNGKSYSGNNISVIGDKIMVDGKDVSPNEKEITIIVDGNLEGNLSCDVCSSIDIKGEIQGDVKTMSGDIKCGDIKGRVKTMSGDVRASAIYGGANTMSGDIIHK